MTGTEKAHKASFTSIFLLPFALRCADTERQMAIPGLAALHGLRERLRDALCASGWEPAPLGPHEGGYFHSHARDLLKDRLRLSRLRLDDTEVPPEGGGFWIAVDLGERRVTDLLLKQVHIHLFDIGIGVLSFHVEGELPFEDLLLFNERFRYLDIIYKDQPRGRQITIQWQGVPFHERAAGDAAASPWQNVLIRGLLDPVSRASRDAGWVLDPLDRRMALLCCAGLPPDQPIDDQRWLPLLFVDTDPAGSFDGDEAFARELRERHEYRRWWRRTRIGFTRYSAAFLIDQANPHFAHLPGHVAGTYQSLAILTYLQHAKLLDLKHHAALLAGSRDLPQELWRNLKETYLVFATRYWSIEMTTFDQGIEMSARWAQILDSPALFHEVREEIERFEADANTRATQQLNARIERLTKITVGLGALAVWFGLLGANDPTQVFRWTDWMQPTLKWTGIFSAGILLLFGVIHGVHRIFRRT